MRRTGFLWFVVILMGLYFLSYAQDKGFKYVGVKKCKTCHKSKKSGEQYKIWSDGPHANAIKSLSSKEALEYAEKNNIADPAKEKKCLKCHSTAASVDKTLLEKTISIDEGVSCESCHGPGSEYKSMKIMKNHTAALKNGLVIPDEKVCKTCHTPEGNPFYKPFDYKKYSSKIAHPVPVKK